MRGQTARASEASEPRDPERGSWGPARERVGGCAGAKPPALTDVVIVGGGQAGLAMSRCLSDLRIEHVVLERGQVAERWRRERWDSLRLLTPNWMTRLPGFQYDGTDPDGFMTANEVAGFLERYARSFPAPVETDTSVEAIEADASSDTFLVTTTRGTWRTRNVVIATGYSDRPLVPAMASRLDAGVRQIVPAEYRSPAALPGGGVVVVGASATGIQLADEIQASGRQVVLSTGTHLRVPRRYRGRDIMWWLDRAGILDETEESVYDLEISRNAPSFQLVGTTDHATLNLRRLRRAGVIVAGRLAAIDGHRLRFDDDLVKTTAAADAKLAGLLSRLDRVAETTGLRKLVGEPEPFEPLWPAFVSAPTDLDLKAAGIESVVWATGYRRDYSWLKLPLLDGRGELVHQGGVTAIAGVYAIGLLFQRTRKSTFIDGVGADARVLATHIAERLGKRGMRASRASEPREPERGSRGPASERAGGSAGAKPPAPSFDVVVIGARCAGAATAMLLARAGHRVLVVDRGRYGTDTLSTHALMRAGVVQLHRWSVLPAVIAAGTTPVRQATFFYGDEAVSVPIKPRDGIDALYAPRRTVLDPLLVDAAAAAGADIVYGVRIIDVQRSATGRVTGVVLEDESGRQHRVASRVVVGADGMRSTVARMVGASTYRVGAHATGTMYGHWSGLDVDGYGWYFAPGLSAGAIPTNAGQVCVSISVPAPAFARLFAHQPDKAFRELLSQVAPVLARQIDRGGGQPRLHGFPGQPGFYRHAHGPGWALVGDAGYFKDPLTAHGITDALRDAELLASAIDDGSDDAFAEYQEQRDAASVELFETTDAIASFGWNLTDVRVLHEALAKAMAREVKQLVGA